MKISKTFGELITPNYIKHNTDLTDEVIINDVYNYIKDLSYDNNLSGILYMIKFKVNSATSLDYKTLQFFFIFKINIKTFNKR